MRILINGMPLLGRLTGIGHYARCLLAHLQSMPEIEEVGVFNGKGVVAPEWFLGETAPGGRAEYFERLKSMLRLGTAFGYDLAKRLQELCFWWHGRRGRWHLYHEVNYITKRFSGTMVTTVHDLAFCRFPQFFSRERLEWLQRGVGPSIQKSQAIVVPSEFTRQEILTYFPGSEGRIFVTPEGVSTEEFSPHPTQPGEKERIHHLLGLPHRFLLCLGTREPRKNLHNLMRACLMLPPRLQEEYPLVIAGGLGWDPHYCREELDALTKHRAVYLLGYVPQQELPGLVRAAHGFCFPSLYEGFGLPPLEAASCGTPVLCSNAGSLPEVMGPAAIYVDPLRPEDIAAGIYSLIQDAGLRQQLQRLGPQRARLFSWAECARKTVQVYRHALAGTGRRVASIPLAVEGGQPMAG